jgi:hypothetical protein
MSCEWVEKQISWYLYNELDERERAEVEEHIETCESCSARMERERAFLAKLDARDRLKPSPALLAESRHDLMRSIYRADRLHWEGREAASTRSTARQMWLSMRLWWQPVAATCLVAAGFFGGWSLRSTPQFLSTPQPAAASFSASDAAAGGISGVSLDLQGGKVQISFDETRRKSFSGSLEDPQIQKFLIFAAKNYGNPGVRLDTVDILKERAGDGEIRDTLLYLVANDANAGVRLKALEALKPYARDSGVRQALIGVLTNDDNPGMRVQAIDLLTEASDRSLVGILQGVAQREQNNYVRMRCQNVLQEMNASTETF